MCGISSFKIGKETADVYLGYYGGSLSFDDIDYEAEADDSRYTQDDKYKKEVEADKMRERLSSFTKEELIDAFIDMVDNGQEN